MGETILVEQETAGRRFLAEFSKSCRVHCAFWMKPEGSENWRFYVAADTQSGASLKSAYDLARQILARSGSPLRFEQVQLLSASDALATRVSEIQNMLNPGMPHAYSGTFLGGRPVDGAYLYESQTGVPGWAAA